MSDELENEIAELREKHAIVHPTPFIAQFCGIDPLSGHCSSCIEPGTKDEDGDYSFAEWPCDVIKALDLSASLRALPQEPRLSKEWLDELIEELWTEPQKSYPEAHVRWLHSRAGAEALRDAILSAPSVPLSDPDATKGELK